MKRRTDLNGGDLQLNGEDLTLIDVAINGQPLNEAQYSVKSEKLTILASALRDEVSHKTPHSTSLCRNCLILTVISVNQEFELSIRVRISPEKNLALSGLYKSSSSGSKLLCTQCEAMGFRRITVCGFRFIQLCCMSCSFLFCRRPFLLE